MRYKILIVDDSYINRELLKEMLKDEYDILEAENGKKALEMIEHKEQIDGILLDLIMPEINGFGVIEELSKKGIMKKVPVMIISSEISAENENICFKYGVFDFIGRPFKTSIVRKRVQNMINIYVYKNHLEQQVQEQTAVLRKAYEKLEKQKERVEKLNKDILDMLGTIVEFRNLVLCQDLVQVKMRNFSHFNPPEAQPQCVFFYTIVRIHLVTYSYNGYEFVSYCRKLPDIRKSSGMPACNREF